MQDDTALTNPRLFKMVYISQITTTGMLSINTLNRVIEEGQIRNKKEKVSGVLCYGNGYFFQYIEATEQVLTNFKNALLKDDRHKNITILAFSSIEERRFCNFWMHSVILDEWVVKDKKMKDFLPFEPNKWEDNQWRSFLQQLQQSYNLKDLKQTRVSLNPTYHALGFILSRIIIRHQAFLLVQIVIGILIVLSILWMLVTGKA